MRGLVLHAATPAAADGVSAGHSLLLLLHGSTEDRNNGSVHYAAERFERNYHAVFGARARGRSGWACDSA